MKAKMLLITTVILFTMSSCKKDSSDYLNVDIHISYIDKNGIDLLNSSNPNAIKAADIDLYYLKNGIKTRVFDPNMDTPENFKIEYSESQHVYLIKIFINEYYDTNKMSETYIEFGGRSDTIKASWYANESKSNIHYLNVWYNNVLKIAEGSSIDFFEVVLD